MGDAGDSEKAEGGGLAESTLTCEAKWMATQAALPFLAHEINNAANQLILSRSLLEEICRDLVPVLKQYAQENGECVLGGLSSSDVGAELPRLLEGMCASTERVRRVAAELKRLGQGAASVPVEPR